MQVTRILESYRIKSMSKRASGEKILALLKDYPEHTSQFLKFYNDENEDSEDQDGNGDHNSDDDSDGSYDSDSQEDNSNYDADEGEKHNGSFEEEDDAAKDYSKDNVFSNSSQYTLAHDAHPLLGQVITAKTDAEAAAASRFVNPMADAEMPCENTFQV